MSTIVWQLAKLYKTFQQSLIINRNKVIYRKIFTSRRRRMWVDMGSSGHLEFGPTSAFLELTVLERLLRVICGNGGVFLRCLNNYDEVYFCDRWCGQFSG